MQTGLFFKDQGWYFRFQKIVLYLAPVLWHRTLLRTDPPVAPIIVHTNVQIVLPLLKHNIAIHGRQRTLPVFLSNWHNKSPSKPNADKIHLILYHIEGNLWQVLLQ